MKKCKNCGSTEFLKNGNCAPCQRLACKKWHAKNRDEVIQRLKKWRQENPNKRKAADAARYKRNPEEKKRSVSEWRSNNPEKRRIHDQNRRARERNVIGGLSIDIIGRLLKLQKGKCVCCGEPLGDDFHVDHIIPLALGGSNTDENIQLLRAACNMEKHATHPIDFMRSRGFLL